MAKQPSSYTETAVINDIAASAQSSGNDYKCIITIFFFGGIDTHNILVPTGSNPNLPIYEELRLPDVRMEQNEILPLGSNAQWGINENMPFLKTLWDRGDIAFIHDVGTLNEPTTREQYLADKVTYAPEGVFAHNVQQRLWATADLPGAALTETGWMGRTANLIHPEAADGKPPIFNVSQTVDSAAVSFVTDLQTVCFEPLSVVNYKSVELSSLDTKGVVDSNDLTAAENDIRNVGPNSIPPSSNLIVQSLADIYEEFASDQKNITDKTFTWEDDTNLTQAQKDNINDIFEASNNPAGSLLPFARSVCEVIYSQKSVGNDGFKQRRQLIFVSTGGWDNHSNLRDIHIPKIKEVNFLIKIILDFAQQIGAYDDIVINHQADFNRTLRSNGTRGTDHAWGGHSFVIGKAVNSGFYPTGYQPNFTINGPKSVDSALGRYIPEVSINQVYAKLLNWFGIPEQHLDLILPNLPAFCKSSNNLDFKFASGNYTLNFI